VPFNIPNYQTNNLSFGPGILYLGPPGATPTVDVGAVRAGAELAITRELLEVRQGSQQNLIKEFVMKEEVQLKVMGIEWNLERMKDALGAGVLTTSSTLDTLLFGGDANAVTRAVRFIHRMPVGHTITIDLWTASPSAEFNITFGEEIHEFPFIFSALDTSTDWASAATNENGRLMRILRQKS
jgi:hypothetical protein